MKFKPKKEDLIGNSNEYSVDSDIDVIAITVNAKSENTVSVISCKSWQNGFDIDSFYDCLTDENKKNNKVGNKKAWKHFRELVEPHWAKAFRETIFRETGLNNFIYYIAVTKIKNNRDSKLDKFKNCELFLNNLSDNGKYKVEIKFLTLEYMLSEIFEEKKNTTLEATEIGRFIQLIKAADLKVTKIEK